VNESAPGRMDMGDIVSGAWNTYRRAPLPWLALTLATLIVTFAAQLALGDRLDLGSNPTEEQIEDASLAFAAFGSIVLIADLFTHVAVVAGAVTVLGGKTLRVARVYKAGARAFLPVVAGTLAVGLVIMLLVVPVAVLPILGLLILPLAVFLLVNWSLLVQVLVDEGGGPLKALGRSRQIVRGQWWRTLGINLAIVLLSFLPGFLLGRVTAPFDQLWLSALAGAVAGAVISPFAGIAQTLLYADLRARKGERPLTAPLGESL